MSSRPATVANRPDYLNKLVASKRLTADGRDWLTLALDPFHDYAHQPAGYPDSDGSQTVVACYQYQTELTAPAGVAGNWDAHICTMPTCSNLNHTLCLETADWSNSTETATAVPLGPLTIVRCAAGDSLAPDFGMPATTVVTALPSANSVDLSSGVSRILGIGYEVTNTTAEINKQGSVTSYRMPQFYGDAGAVSVTNAASTVRGMLPVMRARRMPGSLAQVNLLKGTRTWDASSGVYAVATLNSIHNPLKMVSTTAHLYSYASYPGTPYYNYVSPYINVAANAAPALSPLTPAVTQSMPYDTTGSMFTGLSNNTTLTVKLKVYVERAPTASDPTLSVLATPSAGYDPFALELYSKAISELPVAVTVAENGLGDWFRAVVRTLKNVATPVTEIVSNFVPGAKPVGKTIGAILGRMDSFMHDKAGKPESISNMATKAVVAAKKPRKKRSKA